jgi:trehalose/maltose hydrolase-like predicted phosphorylase
MDRRRSVTAAALLILVPLLTRCSGDSNPPDASTVIAPGAGSYVLTTTSRGATYAPPFTGNGELGIRVPPLGQGRGGGDTPADAQLAGFYAQAPGAVQQRADIPNWTPLTFSEGTQSFAPTAGQDRDWSQSIDLRTGVITTSSIWTAADGRVTKLSYQVLTDRARADVALVRLTVVPRWSGLATVIDSIDGSSAALSTQVTKGWVPSERRDWVAVRAEGTGIEAVLVSQLATSPDVRGSIVPVDQLVEQSVGQRLRFNVVSGHSYTVTKLVTVVRSGESRPPEATAQQESAAVAARGPAAVFGDNDAAWAALWADRIDVLGNETLATEMNASEFYLWASARRGVDWSLSPGGLSSDGYNGHVFWDAETWMYPALLAQHPDLAEGIDDYRYARLAAARLHAAATGYQGARYPWESALDGTEQIPPPASLFTEGLYEQHITADIAIAQWQYYLATGNKAWLRRRGWPVIAAAAAFWASRASGGPGQPYHIDAVTGPDEENPDVDDDVYTNAAAAISLQDATAAAKALGLTAAAQWATIASALAVAVNHSLDINPEFSGYDGSMVKQADATLLTYPLGYPLPVNVARNDVDYYAVRTDPSGPSMSDAINSIDTMALGTPGCAGFVYTVRSVQPYMHDAFDQFSETSSGGVLTFMTGIGGFLQEFLYGYSGFRWGANAVRLAPTLVDGISGIVLRGMMWHGRRFTVTIGSHTSSVTVTGGGTLRLDVGSTLHAVAPGATLVIDTRRPDLPTGNDLVRCGAVSASSWTPNGPPLAAVDGSGATGWRPATVPATLTVRIPGGSRRISGATVRWGQRWPSPPSLTAPPPAGPVTVLRATSYVLQASGNGATWRTLSTVVGRTAGLRDELSFPAVEARYVRIRITASTGARSPLLDELTVRR